MSDRRKIEEEPNGERFTYRFSRPFDFEGEGFEEMAFDFGTLTGADALAIEAELAARKGLNLMQEYTGEYLIRMAARACVTRRKDGRRLGADAFAAMPLAAFTVIKNRARNFLLREAS